LVAFLNTPRSVHGAVEIPKMVARRYFFICNWWKDPPVLRDLAVAPDGALRPADAAAPAGQAAASSGSRSRAGVGLM
jgi:hypothetical protein